MVIMKKIIVIIASVLLGLILIIKGVDYMNEHEKVFVVCNNMCLEEGMTKEAIEETIEEAISTNQHTLEEELVNNNRFYKYSKTYTANGSDLVFQIPFPEGFTIANTQFISAKRLIPNGNMSSVVVGHEKVQINCTSRGIGVNYYGNYNGTSGTTYELDLVFMRMD